MKRLIGLALVAATLSVGCMVTHHGHVAFVPPPALVVAGAIAAAAAVRPGYVWVDGHWDWIGAQWTWSQGYWLEDRPGYLWIQGNWYLGGEGQYHYRPGHWRHR